MNLFRLIEKEFRIEMARMAVLAGLLLYLISTVFILYVSFQFRQNLLNAVVWSALFWVVSFFAFINAGAKSFIGEKKGTDVYYYWLVSPEALLFSKIIYNTLLCMVLAFSGWLIFGLLLSNPIEDTLIFSLLIALAATGFSSTLTLMSGIASRSGNSHVVMSVLSLPVVIGMLLNCVKITRNCIDGLGWDASQGHLLVLLAINVLLTATAYLLFPYIWRS
ncbi:MAG: heme exporter protein CcmB [Cyclobacteriaceae bacterium]